MNSLHVENKTNKTLLGATAVEPDQPADMSAIAVGTGLVASAVTLMLAAVVVCLVRSRRLQQEQGRGAVASTKCQGSFIDLKQKFTI